MPARAFRRLQWRRRMLKKRMSPPTSTWAAWASVDEARVLRHFTAAARIRGIPHKAKVAILRLLWRKTVLPAAGTRQCPLCMQERAGEGDEHTFMTCQVAKQMWMRVAAALAWVGVEVDVLMRDTLVAGGPVLRSPSGVRGARLWRAMWAGTVWSIWRAYCAARRGDPVSPSSMWLWAHAVWKDADRVRRAEEVVRAREDERCQADNDLWRRLLSETELGFRRIDASITCAPPVG